MGSDAIEAMDLNLLTVLYGRTQTCGVTGAANRQGVSKTAVS